MLLPWCGFWRVPGPAILPARPLWSTAGWSCRFAAQSERGRAAFCSQRKRSGLPPRYRMTFNSEETMADSAEARVKEIIINELGVEPEKVTSEASFVEDLGADSLDTVELVMAFEEEFGIEIPDEDAEQLQTVGDAIRYLQEKGGGS